MNGEDDRRSVCGPVPDLLLERLARGELPAERAAELRRRLEAEGPAGAARLAALEASNRDILEALPPAVVTAEVHRRAALARTRAGSTARVSRRWTFALPTLALGAVGALLLFASGRNDPIASEGPERIKGGPKPQLAVFRKQGNRPQRLAPGALVKPGDRLQLSYVAGGRRYGVVASVDARGSVTLHLPEAAGQAAALSAKGETVLPHAFELDDSPGSERFVFASSDRPFATDTVVASLRPGGPALPGELQLVDVTVHRSQKETR